MLSTGTWRPDIKEEAAVPLKQQDVWCDSLLLAAFDLSKVKSSVQLAYNACYPGNWLSQQPEHWHLTNYTSVKVARWRNGWSVGLAINRSRVQILLGLNPGIKLNPDNRAYCYHRSCLFFSSSGRDRHKYSLLSSHGLMASLNDETLQSFHHHNHFTALFPGPPAKQRQWASARRELLDFMVQGKINGGRHTVVVTGRLQLVISHCFLYFCICYWNTTYFNSLLSFYCCIKYM